MHHKKGGCTRGSALHPGDIPRGRTDGRGRDGVKVTGCGQITISLRPGRRRRPRVNTTRDLSLICQCVSTARSLHKWDVLLPASLSARHSVPVPSSLTMSPTGYGPLNPLISSRVFSPTTIDSVGRRDGTRRAERIVLFSTKPGLRVQFLPLPKAGRDDVDDNRPQVAADIYRGGGDGHGHQTSVGGQHHVDLTDNGAKRRDVRPGPTLLVRTEQQNAREDKHESMNFVPSPIP